MPLLADAVSTKTLSGAPTDFKMHTHCSGTDNVSIALELGAELARANDLDAFAPEHLLSCEIEPFKQAYIARNFPQVVVSPDVSLLAKTKTGEKFQTIYRGEQVVPPCDVLVGGSSCKDFSNLKMRYHVSGLEDEGQSGTTFRAIVNNMYKDGNDGPKLVILENVESAPWDKMEEYINGRVKLATINEKLKGSGKCKAGDDDDVDEEEDSDDDDEGGGKKKKGAKKKGEDELMFDVGADGFLYVASSPPHIGIIEGLKLLGVGADIDATPKPIKKEVLKALGKKCSLSQLAKAAKLDMSSKKMTPARAAKQSPNYPHASDKLYENKSVLAFEMPCSYRTQRIKVDTKDFGLPQTRSRYYMFCWRTDTFPDVGVCHREIGERWVELVEAMHAPMVHPVADFLLRDDHDVVRRFRDMCQGRIGENFAFLKGKGDFYADTTLKQVKGQPKGVKAWQTSFDLEVNMAFKEGAGIPIMHRPYTNWGPNGQLKLRSPAEWTEYIRLLGGRERDLIDSCSVKCAEAEVDVLHQMVVWDISQNIHLVKTLNLPGVSCCITPGGKNFLSSVGRSMLGYEKLLLQGIPPDRLLLGRETEVQLSDLAGNAMSMPVVSACLLAALVVGSYAKHAKALGYGGEYGGVALNPVLKKLLAGKKEPPPPKPQLAPKPSADDAPFSAVLERLRSDSALLDRAVASSILCSCETSGRISADPVVGDAETGGRLVSICGGCSARFDASSHDLSHEMCDKRARPRLPFEFEREIRTVMPASVRLEAGDLDAESLGMVDGLELRLTRVVRGRGEWTLWYCAYSEGGSSSLADLRVTLGHVSTRRGVVALLYSLHKARNKQPGKAYPAARLVMYEDDAPKGKGKASAAAPAFEKRVSQAKLEVRLAGSEPQPSWRSELQLKNFAKEEWPGKMTIATGGGGKGAAAAALADGEYERVDSRGSCAHDLLYKRTEPAPSASCPPTWLLLVPEPNHNGDCIPVISTSPLYREAASHAIVALPADWRPKHALKKAKAKAAESDDDDDEDLSPKKKGGKQKSIEGAFKVQKVDKIDKAIKALDAKAQMWAPTTLAFAVPPETTKVAAGADASTLCTVDGMPASTAKMLVESATSTELGHMGAAQEKTKGVKAAKGDAWKPLALMRVSSSVVERRLAEAIARPLLSFAASGGLEKFGDWQPLKQAKGAAAWGQCPRAVPPRPEEKWDGTRRSYDVTESNAFERAMRERPHFWASHVHEGTGAVRLSAEPEVAAHRAAEGLLRDRAMHPRGKLDVAWQLKEHAEPEQGALQGEFSIPSSKQFAPVTDAIPGWDAEKPLFDRQARALRRMVDVEAGAVDHIEEDYYDETLPHVGFSLQARARQSRPLGGGVLADVMGGGKTVTALALVAAGKEAATAALAASTASNPPTMEGGGTAAACQHLKATLVVAPPILLAQWDDERKKFTGSSLKCVVIRSAEALKSVKVSEMRSADLILVVSDLLGIDKATAQDKAGQKGKDNYLSHLAKTVGLGKELPDLMHGNNSVRQAGGEPDVFEGIWLPGFGANPYAGTNGRQCDRHAAALFSTKYEEALAGLRGMSFKDDAKGVPLEYFVYERVIVDECHVPICLASSQKDHNSSQATNGESKFEKAALSSNRSSCAVRELLGVSVPDTSLRPLRWRKSVWGLTGTPLLTSATRITELAAMCAGAYCCGAANHWRTMERASLRDVFLRYHESVPSRLYTAHCVGAAQGYIKAAVQRNKAEEFEGTKEEVAVAVDVPEAETGEVYGQTWNTLEEHKLERAAHIAAASKARATALQGLVKAVHAAEGDDTKLVVFTPSGEPFAAARDALKAAGVPTAVVVDNDDEHNEDVVKSFTQEVLQQALEKKGAAPRVLLLSFENAAGLNLQYVCHHVVLYAPLWAQDTVAAVANEQQAIGRVYRYGQTQQVTVHRMLMHKEGTSQTVDEHLHAMNTAEATINAATNI